MASSLRLLTASAAALVLSSPAAWADFVINDDLIVDGSACVGFDCVNGESFSFDTLILKENNLRILFNDTSVASSFPRNDWRLTANDSANGGASYFGIEDATAGRIVFRVSAGAPAHALFVDSQGDVGMGTSTPATEMHAVDGDTPTLRLEQNGTSGFAPQTWDLAGNETSFFIRDASNGSTLPFRVFPGAPNQSLVIGAETGHVGMGVTSPQSNLHIVDSDGDVAIRFDDGSAGDDLVMELDGDKLFIAFQDAAGAALTIRQNGQVEVGLNNLEVNNGHNLELNGGGGVIVGGTTLNVPDYVFAPDYELMPLADLAAFIAAHSHLPGVPSAEEVNATGLDMTAMQLNLLKKVEELTLYTLKQQAALDELDRLRARVAELETLLAK